MYGNNKMKQKELIFNGFDKNLVLLMKKTAEFVLNSEKIKEYSISFTQITDIAIKKMNRKYRKVNRITDVISFLVDKKLFMGDIYISDVRPRKNAKKYGLPYKQEICYLVIHSILHLEGYTDYTPENKKKMFSKQDKIFKCIFS